MIKQNFHLPGGRLQLQGFKYALAVVLAAGLYALFGQLGFAFAPPNADTTPIWLPSALALAVLVLGGLRMLPAVALGSVMVSIFFSNQSPAGMVLTTIVDVTEPAIAFLVLSWLRFDPALCRVRDVAALTLAVPCTALVVSATLGTLVFWLQGQLLLSDYWQTWVVYWVANSSACVTVAPVLLAWSVGDKKRSRHMPRASRFAEAGLLLLLIVGIAAVIWIPDDFGLFFEFEYALFPPLIWAGLRFGARGTTVAIIIGSMIAIWGTANGGGPFGDHEIGRALLMMQMYIAVFAITGHLLAAVAEERATAERGLLQARNSLESTVVERTAAVVQSNAFLNVILDSVSAAILACDTRGKPMVYNQAIRDMYSLPGEELSFENWGDHLTVFRADGITRLPDAELPLYRALQGEDVMNAEIVIKHISLEPKTLLVSGRSIEDEQGERLGAVIVANDISERKRSEDLQRLVQLAASASNEAPDEEQAVLMILEAVCHYIGWPVGHALQVEDHGEGLVAVSTRWWFIDNETYTDFRRASEAQSFVEGIDLPGRVLASHRPEWIANLGAETSPGRFPMVDTDGLVSGFAFPVLAGSRLVAVLEFFSSRRAELDANLMVVMRSIGTQLGRVYERTEARRKLMRMSLRDALTGLPNRLAFQDVLRQAIAHSKRRTGYSFAVLFLDLDRFKVINDSLGHAAGDQLLLEVARRVQLCLRDGDSLARLGGDEFTVLLDDLGQRSDGANAAKVATRISESLKMPFVIAGEEVFISVSIGVLISNSKYDQPEEMLRDADTAMYQAKASGKGEVSIFSAMMHTNAMTILRLENDLRRALENNEFLLHYQPVINMTSGQVLGFEALLRWMHPTRGMVSPMEFVPASEESGLIVPIGKWALLTACRWLKHLDDEVEQDTSGLTVSVNVSAVQFRQRSLDDDVRQALSESGLEPGRLKLEIVESTLMSNQQAVDMLESLRNLGIQILIDDFGTGFSSLAYLVRLPIDALKIDRSFVREMENNGQSVEIVRCILAMASALRLGVIAEGVETLEQASALQALGCNSCQGFLYSRPLPADQVPNYLNNHKQG